MAQAVFTAGRTSAWSAPRWRPRQASVLAFALLAPSLLFLALFTYWPVAQVLWQSMHGQIRVGGPQAYVGLDNFQKLLADAAFRKALVNNLVYALGTVIPSLVLALGFAMALVKTTRVNALFRALFFLPVLIPLVAAASIFLFLFLPNVGLIDYHLAKLAISGPNWLGDPDIALWSIMALTIWKNAGYYMLFFLAGLQAVPADAYEAAILDGAGPWQRLRYVTLPYLKPTIGFVLVIGLLNVVTQVDHVFVLTKGGPSDSTNLLLFYVYQQAVENYDAGRAAAGTLVMLALLLVVTASSLRTLERSFGEKEP
ncbi:sugar ABC transporter permease [Bosea sp. 124]|uniref:carbohydrate ABC transporter permease n=1 Tax=Bosea sp. 124 TaxID=2135642 RepID=UPI000D331FC7|nr:sugar ABC transporter permease [Bosea sp. 124]PTM41169.1 carbohydrate ABC transporter membrane protein 1 (CUT1 family) [Bosea sp. 124]